MTNKTIGILGSNGFIGNILKKYYPGAKGYDIKGPCDPLEEVLAQDIIFISFLHPDNMIDDVMPYARKAPAGRIFIIKSTFIPGSTDLLQELFSQHKFIYNPEFLTEATAWEDFTKPQFQILGVPYQSLDLIHEIFSLLPEAPIKRVISPLDAEILKHSFNSFFALKVTWFNQLYDACQTLHGDYETVREIMVSHPWIGDSHSHIFHKGYRGYGGKCLAKDPKAFAQSCPFPLITQIEKYNERLLIQQTNKSSNPSLFDLPQDDTLDAKKA